MQNLADYIPEIHYDITARVIPGYAFIKLVQAHYPNWLVNGQSLDFMSLLVASYIIGFAIEQILCLIDHKCISKFIVNEKVNNFLDLFVKVDEKTGRKNANFLKHMVCVNKLWDYYDNLDNERERAVFLKKMGERVMFLALAAIGIATMKMPLRFYAEIKFGVYFIPVLISLICLMSFYNINVGAAGHLQRPKKHRPEPA